jgi:hypothetical protein
MSTTRRRDDVPEGLVNPYRTNEVEAPASPAPGYMGRAALGVLVITTATVGGPFAADVEVEKVTEVLLVGPAVQHEDVDAMRAGAYLWPAPAATA